MYKKQLFCSGYVRTFTPYKKDCSIYLAKIITEHLQLSTYIHFKIFRFLLLFYAFFVCKEKRKQHAKIINFKIKMNIHIKKKRFLVWFQKTPFDTNDQL